MTNVNKVHKYGFSSNVIVETLDVLIAELEPIARKSHAVLAMLKVTCESFQLQQLQGVL